MWFVISIYWHRAPKNPFNFLSDRSKDDLWYPSQNSLNYTWVYANKMTFDKYLRVGVGCQGTNPMTGGWTFSHRLPTFRERKVTGDSSITNGQWFNQSCHIRQWTLYKKKKKKDLRSEGFQVGRNAEMSESGMPKEGVEAACLFPHVFIYASLPSGCSWVLSFYNTSVF